MSRGPGSVMVAVESVLRDALAAGYPGVRAADVAYFVYGDDPTTAQKESVRRAIRIMLARGTATRTPSSRVPSWLPSRVTGVDGKNYPRSKDDVISPTRRGGN